MAANKARNYATDVEPVHRIRDSKNWISKVFIITLPPEFFFCNFSIGKRIVSFPLLLYSFGAFLSNADNGIVCRFKAARMYIDPRHPYVSIITLIIIGNKIPPRAEPEVTNPVERPTCRGNHNPERVCEGTYRKQYPKPAQ